MIFAYFAQMRFPWILSVVLCWAQTYHTAQNSLAREAMLAKLLELEALTGKDCQIQIGKAVGDLREHKLSIMRAMLEGKANSEVRILFRQGSKRMVFDAYLKEGQAEISWPLWEGSMEVILSAPGYLSVRYGQLITAGQALDFTDPKNLHPESGFVIIKGKAHLAAGDLGRLPDESRAIINAYDIELFYIAQKNQDLTADFNGDGRVDEADLALLMKNQNLLLQSEL